MIILTIKVITGISIILTIALLVFPKQITSIFTTDQELIDLTVKTTRILIFVMPIVGYQIVAGGMYQAMGKALKAFIISQVRHTRLKKDRF